MASSDHNHNADKNQLNESFNQEAAGISSHLQRFLNRLATPASRRHAYNSASSFASSRPVLFSFGLSQLVFSVLPLLVFVAFSAATVAFALGAAIAFALFWIGVALLFLVPTLLVVFTIAILVWGWTLASFFVIRWLFFHTPAPMVNGAPVDATTHEPYVMKDDEAAEAPVDGEH